jgi:hypothetical protein
MFAVHGPQLLGIQTAETDTFTRWLMVAQLEFFRNPLARDQVAAMVGDIWNELRSDRICGDVTASFSARGETSVILIEL